MAWRKPTHEAFLVSKTWKNDEQGKPISMFTKIAAIWQNENGSMFIDIPHGMSISGKIFIKEVAESSPRPSENWDVDEDLPF